jgi:seryl-tRNA synthetase
LELRRRFVSFELDQLASPLTLVQAKEDATELLQERTNLEKEKKVLEESAAEKETILLRKVKTIGNYVHDSVPISNNEVSGYGYLLYLLTL